jgi:hypothetical protein
LHVEGGERRENIFDRKTFVYAALEWQCSEEFCDICVNLILKLNAEMIQFELKQKIEFRPAEEEMESSLRLIWLGSLRRFRLKVF